MLVKKNFKDLVDFSRGSTATGWADGKLREFAIDEPRFVTDPATGYSGLLLEPVAQTNLILNSKLEGGGPNAAPRGWTLVLEDGSLEPLASSFIDVGEAYEFSATDGRAYILADTFVVEANATYTVSIVLEEVAISDGNQVILWASGTPSGTTGRNRIEASEFTTPGVYSISFATSSEPGSIRLRFGVGSLAGPVTGRMVASAPQVVKGSYAGSYTPTGASQVTRAGDRFILPTDRFDYRPDRGTLLVDGIQLGTSQSGAAFAALSSEVNNRYIKTPLGQPSETRGTGSMRNGGDTIFAETGIVVPHGARMVSAISWDGGDFVASANGRVSSMKTQPDGYPVTSELRLATDANTLYAGAGPACVIRRVLYYPERLPDVQLAALTEI